MSEGTFKGMSGLSEWGPTRTMIQELKVLSESDGPRVPRSPVGEVPQGFGLTYNPEHSRQHVLADGFSRLHTYLRISLVEHCNLRCRYCMPEDGLVWTPTAQLLTKEEIIRLARLFVASGVRKIRLTGGEPLLREGIEDIAREIGQCAGLQTLAITTNGLLLPKKLDRLRAAGVNLVNISLDTLRPDRFETITRRRGLSIVLKAIDAALQSGIGPVKVNCVVMRDFNEDELEDFVAWTRELPVQVRFIEFMPFDGNRWNVSRLVSYREMLETLRKSFVLERVEHHPHEVSKTYRVPGFAGTVGFITSMTENFCEGCNRLRITADGNLKVCLFGRAEISLRDAIRQGATNEELLELISQAIGKKRARHAGMHNLATMSNRPMITIGG